MTTTLFVSFKGTTYEIKRLHRTIAQIDTAYHNSKRDGMYIVIEIDSNESTHDYCEPVTYRLYDTRTAKDLRRGHTIITTSSHPQIIPSDVMQVSNNIGLANLKWILHREPHTIARLIKEVEKRFVRYSQKDKPVFSDRTRETFYEGLPYELIRQKVEDRPKGL